MTRSPTTPRRWIRDAIPLAVLTGLVACGGGGGGTPMGPGGPTGSPPPILDFSAIEGTWSGWAAEDTGGFLWLRWEFDASAPEGEAIASHTRGIEMNGTLVTRCVGELVARESTPPSYVVTTRAERADCPVNTNGTVTLQHDPVAGTLFHRFEAFDGSFTAEGTLRPGPDPGPSPAPPEEQEA